MEIWKDIKGYEGLYQVSNLGNVKSLQRTIIRDNGIILPIKEKILKQKINTVGYYCLNFYKNKIQKTVTVHQIVAESFLNHTPCGFKFVVNHKDFNRLNNNIENLEIITQRENANQKHLSGTSKFVGVSFITSKNKWYSCIRINGKKKNLGLFINEYDAHLAYEKALNELNQSKI